MKKKILIIVLALVILGGAIAFPFVRFMVDPKDTEEFYRNSVINMIIEDEESCFIKAYSIDDFVSVTQNKINLQDMQNYKANVVTKMREKFA